MIMNGSVQWCTVKPAELATALRAPPLNIPGQFLYTFVLYKSATFTWAPSASKFIPKTQIPVKILIAHNYWQLTSSVN